MLSLSLDMLWENFPGEKDLSIIQLEKYCCPKFVLFQNVRYSQMFLSVTKPALSSIFFIGRNPAHSKKYKCSISTKSSTLKSMFLFFYNSKTQDNTCLFSFMHAFKTDGSCLIHSPIAYIEIA